MRTNGRSLVIAALVIVFLSAHAPSTLAAQAKPLVKVVVGYGSTDGGVAILRFAKETKLFEKRGIVRPVSRTWPIWSGCRSLNLCCCRLQQGNEVSGFDEYIIL